MSPHFSSRFEVSKITHTLNRRRGVTLSGTRLTGMKTGMGTGWTVVAAGIHLPICRVVGRETGSRGKLGTPWASISIWSKSGMSLGVGHVRVSRVLSRFGHVWILGSGTGTGNGSGNGTGWDHAARGRRRFLNNGMGSGSGGRGGGMGSRVVAVLDGRVSTRRAGNGRGPSSTHRLGRRRDRGNRARLRRYRWTLCSLWNLKLEVFETFCDFTGRLGL